MRQRTRHNSEAPHEACKSIRKRAEVTERLPEPDPRPDHPSRHEPPDFLTSDAVPCPGSTRTRPGHIDRSDFTRSNHLAYGPRRHGQHLGDLQHRVRFADLRPSR